MELSVYVNGKFLPQSEAKVSVFDHGLLYGDGVFEGIRAYNGRVFKLERHMERLFHSAKAIDLKIPHTKEDLAKIVLETCRHNDIKEGYIRPIITRGPGDLGLDPRKCKSGPSIVVIAQPSINLLGKVYERGLKVVTSSYRRVPPQSLSPSIKSLNYLNNIMAKVEANQYGADEALMLDIQGYVSEASADNFFIVQNHSVITPPTSTNLPGVTGDRPRARGQARIPHDREALHPIRCVGLELSVHHRDRRRDRARRRGRRPNDRGREAREDHEAAD